LKSCYPQLEYIALLQVAALELRHSSIRNYALRSLLDSRQNKLLNTDAFIARSTQQKIFLLGRKAKPDACTSSRSREVNYGCCAWKNLLAHIPIVRRAMTPWKHLEAASAD
jgi:hypothetical protein